MFDLRLETMLLSAILSIPATLLVIAIIEDSPNELQDCCEQVGMEFVLYSTYNCLDYQNHKILTVVKHNDQCFYGD